ncbi:MAG: hypothetical protein R6X10_02385 [Desulfobacterales bacterium]
MIDKDGYIKAKLKSQDAICKVYPAAYYWGTHRYLWPSACEAIMPYLGRFVWVKMIRIDLSRFTYELKLTGGLKISPDWIAYFDSEELVAGAKWDDEERTNDIWLDYREEKHIIFDDAIIITG